MRKQIFKITLFIAMFFALSENIWAANQDLPLLQQNDLEYLGAFRVPQGKYGLLSAEVSNSFSYGGAGFAYDQTRNGLILTTNSTLSNKRMIAEISIPEPINSPVLNNLNVATIIQNPIDIVNNQLDNLGLDLEYSSTSEVEFGTGSKTFLLENVPKWAINGSISGMAPNLPVTIVLTSDNSKYMSGVVVSNAWINSNNIASPTENSIGQATLVVNITETNGSGTFNDWNFKTTGNKIGNGGVYGSFLVWNDSGTDKLLGNAWAYYDASHKAFNSHYNANLDWTNQGSGFTGFYRVGINPFGAQSPNGGFVGGYMASIPAQWQADFESEAMTGLGGIAIIARSSFGPSLWTFNPGDVGSIQPAPAQMLIGYPSNHTTLGDYVDNPSLYYNRATEVRGMIFPENTRSILFFWQTWPWGNRSG